MSIRVTVTAMQVTNTRPGHNKFYRIYVVGSREIRQWGKINTKGQVKSYQRASTMDALISARTKIDEEIMKGYSGKDTRTFEMPEADSTSIAQLMTAWQHAARVNLGSSVQEPDPEIHYDEDEPDPRVQHLLWDKEPA